MNRRLLLRHIATIVMVAALSVASAFAQNPPASARRIKRESRPIEQRIVANETHVIVEELSAPHGMMPSKKESWLLTLKSVGDLIVIVEVTERYSQLDSAGDWIQTTVVARVVERINAREGVTGWLEGDVFSFSEEGGDVMMGNTRVFATVPDVQPLAAGRRYLLFQGLDPAGEKIVVDPRVTFEILDNGRLKRVATGPMPGDDIEGQSLTSIVERLSVD